MTATNASPALAVAAPATAPTCPACGSASATPAWRVDAAEAAQHFILRESSPARHEALRQHIASLWRMDTCTVMSCAACGFGFAWPYIAGDATFYDLAYEGVTYPTQRWEFDRTIEAIRRLPIAVTTALEIGAGDGAFLDMLGVRRAKRGATVAVELTGTSRDILTAKGYRAIGVDIVDDVAFPSDVGPFDFVFMFQVLEHMDRIDAVFSRLAELMTAGGHLFIAVPNPVRIDFNERHGGLRDMPPNHIGKWTMAAFHSVAGRHGFEIVAAESEPCPPISLMRQDAESHYLRRAQVPGTVANRLRSRPRNRWRRLAEHAVGIGMSPLRLRAWALALPQMAELGASLWLHLRRE